MIEANIKASDRGRIWVGQKANIEITAYDYGRYGMIRRASLHQPRIALQHKKAKFFTPSK